MDNFAIKPNYTARTEPAYFQDTMPDQTIWQVDVYPIAAYLARLMKRHTLIDIGCGRAHKLIQYAGEFNLIGVDTGDNLTYCRDHYPEHTWVTENLETTGFKMSGELLNDSIVIVADVVEHLIDPLALLALLRSITHAPILLTTPDRLRSYGYDHDGPPSNTHHTREHSLHEMTTLLKAHNIPVTWAGYTASENRTFAKNTMLLMLGLDAPYAQAIEQTFDVEAVR